MGEPNSEGGKKDAPKGKPDDESLNDLNSIGDLDELPSVGPTLMASLQEEGYNTLELIAVASPRELSAATGIGEATAQKIILSARSKLSMGVVTGEELHESRIKIFKITTGSEKLDGIIGGGIESKSITEAYGEFRTGKTQLAIQLSVTTQLPVDEGGVDGAVLFIDCEGTFRTERVLQIVSRYDLDEEEILENIFYARAYNSDHQLLILETAPATIREKNVKVIIVDGLMSHFRYEYIGRGAATERDEKLGKFLHKLGQLAEGYNLAVFVTNQVYDDECVFFGDPTRPTGGHIVAHCSQKILYLRKSKGDKRVARLVKSPYLPDGEAMFEITASGIEDI